MTDSGGPTDPKWPEGVDPAPWQRAWEDAAKLARLDADRTAQYVAESGNLADLRGKRPEVLERMLPIFEKLSARQEAIYQANGHIRFPTDLPRLFDTPEEYLAFQRLTAELIGVPRGEQFAAPQVLGHMVPLMTAGLRRDATPIPRDQLPASIDAPNSPFRGARVYLYVEKPGGMPGSALVANLFKDLPEEQVYLNEREIYRTLTPAGLQVVGLVLHECYHNSRQPWFALDIDQALDTLGHTRDQRGVHHSRSRKRFIEHLTTISQRLRFGIEVRQPKNSKQDRGVRVAGPLIMITDTFEEWETAKGKPLEQGAKVRDGIHVLVHPKIYQQMQQGWFTWLPDKLLAEDAQKHGETISLVTYFGVQWRIGWREHHGTIHQRLRTMLEQSGVIDAMPKRSDHKREWLRNIVDEFDYMQKRNYIASYDGFPTEWTPNSLLDSVVTVTIPPDHGLKRMGTKPPPAAMPSEAAVPLATGDDLKRLRESAGLSQNEFAKAVGVSQGYITQAESGKRRITAALRGKILRWRQVITNV